MCSIFSYSGTWEMWNEDGISYFPSQQKIQTYIFMKFRQTIENNTNFMQMLPLEVQI